MGVEMRGGSFDSLMGLARSVYCCCLDRCEKEQRAQIFRLSWSVISPQSGLIDMCGRCDRDW